MFWTQFSFPVVFQGDLWWRPRWHVYFFVYDFSSFHPNNFRNTTSWKCFLKDDCIRSSLIEFQSFLNGKIDVDPIYCVLMSFPCFIPRQEMHRRAKRSPQRSHETCTKTSRRMDNHLWKMEQRWFISKQSIKLTWRNIWTILLKLTCHTPRREPSGMGRNAGWKNFAIIQTILADPRIQDPILPRQWRRRWLSAKKSGECQTYEKKKGNACTICSTRKPRNTWYGRARTGRAILKRPRTRHLHRPGQNLLHGGINHWVIDTNGKNGKNNPGRNKNGMSENEMRWSFTASGNGQRPSEIVNAWASLIQFCSEFFKKIAFRWWTT